MSPTPSVPSPLYYNNIPDLQEVFRRPPEAPTTGPPGGTTTVFIIITASQALFTYKSQRRPPLQLRAAVATASRVWRTQTQPRLLLQTHTKKSRHNNGCVLPRRHSINQSMYPSHARRLTAMPRLVELQYYNTGYFVSTFVPVRPFLVSRRTI